MRVVMVAVALVLCSSAQSFAGGQHDFVASECVPDLPSIQNALYTQANGSISFASGKTGTIVLHCPLTNVSSNTSSNPAVTITYADGSNSAGYKIQFSVYSIKKTDGTLALFLDNNTDVTPCQGGSTAVHQCSITSLVPFDSTNYYYILEIYLNRPATTANEVFYGAELK